MKLHCSVLCLMCPLYQSVLTVEALKLVSHCYTTDAIYLFRRITCFTMHPTVSAKLWIFHINSFNSAISMYLTKHSIISELFNQDCHVFAPWMYFRTGYSEHAQACLQFFQWLLVILQLQIQPKSPKATIINKMSAKLLTGHLKLSVMTLFIMKFWIHGGFSICKIFLEQRKAT